MNALDRLETLLQELMERPAALLTSKRLHPIQLAGALTKELESRAILLVDRVLVPDEYELRISAGDWLGLESVRPALETELADYVARLAGERDLTLGAPVRVHLQRDSSLRQGEVRARASFQARPKPSEPAERSVHNPTVALPRQLPEVALRERSAAPPAAGTASLVLLGPGDRALTRFTLERSLVRIGRRSSNEIALADAKVSREHARVERRGLRYYLVDAGSTNGVRINGQEAPGRNELRPGDVIEIGLQRLRFEP